MNIKNTMVGAIKALCVAAIFTSTAAYATPVTYTGPSNGYIDTSSATFTSFNIATSGLISALNVFVNIGSAYADDVTFSLMHNGITALLYSGHGDSYSSVINATFSDSATSSAPYNGSAIGTFSPAQALSAFIGQELSGTWTLKTQDFIVAGDGTPLLAWSISAETVPEPGTVALLALGLLGFAVTRRKMANKSV
jgi:subtilisin-like proprotein convertase family protein